MSVEKMNDDSEVHVEEKPYAQVYNKIVEHIKDNDAFRMYVFLAMRSRNWSVVKQWTAKQCGVGQRKAKQCWAYLERCGLIEYIRKRNENGAYTEFDIRVLNGSKFNPHESFHKTNDTTGAESAPLEKLSTETPHQWCKNPPGGETTRVGFAPLLNKDITNKDVDTKKRKSFCANAPEKPKSQKPKSDWQKENAKKHDWAEKKNNAVQSTQQMEKEAKHIEESETYKRTPMPDYLREMVKKMRMSG